MLQSEPPSPLRGKVKGTMFTFGDVLRSKSQARACKVDRYAAMRQMIFENADWNTVDVLQAIELVNDASVLQWRENVTCEVFVKLLRQRMCDEWLARIIYFAPIN